MSFFSTSLHLNTEWSLSQLNVTSHKSKRISICKEQCAHLSPFVVCSVQYRDGGTECNWAVRILADSRTQVCRKRVHNYKLNAQSTNMSYQKKPHWFHPHPLANLSFTRLQVTWMHHKCDFLQCKTSSSLSSKYFHEIGFSFKPKWGNNHQHCAGIQPDMLLAYIQFCMQTQKNKTMCWQKVRFRLLVRCWGNHAQSRGTCAWHLEPGEPRKCTNASSSENLWSHLHPLANLSFTRFQLTSRNYFKCEVHCKSHSAKTHPLCSANLFIREGLPSKSKWGIDHKQGVKVYRLMCCLLLNQFCMHTKKNKTMS